MAGKRLGSVFDIPQISTPSANPGSGYQFLYLKSDGRLYTKNSAGTEVMVGDGAAASAVVPISTTQPGTDAGDGSLWFDSDDTSTVNVEPAIAVGTTSQYWRGDKSWQTLDKVAVGLGNVANVLQFSADNKPGATDLSATGTADSTTFFRGDNTWATPTSTASSSIIEVKVATTANITLSGAQTIDGVSCVAGDLVLVKNQTTTANNGVYTVASGAWTRAPMADTAAELAALFARVQQGTIGAGDLYLLYNWTSSSTLGTTAQYWINVGSDEKIIDFGSTSTVAMDLAQGVRNFAVTPTANFTPSFSNVPGSMAVTVTLLVRQGATARTVSLPTNGTWLGSTPTFTNSKDTLVTYYTVDGGSNWYCSAVSEA